MKYIAPAMLAFLLCSCATVVRGTSETAQFESSPSGAAVTAESISEDKMGPFNCVTPCQLELKRKRTWRVDFTLDGYKPVSGLLKPVVTGGGVAAGAGNALIGGLIGIGIDAGTGANLDLRPNPMIAELAPVDSPEMSRILDAELIVDEGDPVVDETINEPSVTDESVMEDGVEGDGSSDENADDPLETDEPAPADEPMSDEEGPDGENAGENDPVASLKNANFPSNDAGPSIVQVNSVPAEATSEEEAEIRRYKPGERAPNDNEAARLNQLQLEKTKSAADQN